MTTTRTLSPVLELPPRPDLNLDPPPVPPPGETPQPAPKTVDETTPEMESPPQPDDPTERGGRPADGKTEMVRGEPATPNAGAPTWGPS